MQPIREQSTSVWMTRPEMQRSAPVKDTQADVCVVGAGIAGMTTAYMLSREGKSVVVLDAGVIGGGQTQRTTAHLSNAIDDRYIEMVRLHGRDGARLAAESHSVAIDRIESIVREESIDCDFERLDGFLFLPPGETSELLDQEREAAHRAGLMDVQRLCRAPVTSFDTGPCLRFPRQGQFDPLRYLDGLARVIERNGGRIFTGTHAEHITGGKQARVETKGGPSITAEAVVVATNTPVNDRVAIHAKQAAYLTYAIGALVPRGSVARGLFWDTADPYHYVRMQHFASRDPGDAHAGAAHDVLIVGGEDHKTGQAHDQSERYARLETWARKRFPAIQQVRFHWSGQIMETVDGLAFIGRNPMDEPNVYIATGDSGMGMTHGTIAGILLTDLIVGRENRWATLYDPSRKSLRAAGHFARENLNVLGQYVDWIAPGDIASVQELQAGAGAIVRRGLTKQAIYRDDHGVLHERSAVCPHLGCVVDWNDAEKTWDCPCHGSRFDRYGSVLNGPANSDLARAEET